jgi:NADPH:quinone reductase-like Zn-dependent oxidoreductase/acyl carrier protein
MLNEFASVVEGLSYTMPALPVVSNRTGRVAGEELCDPGYWVRHVREAVRFADGVSELERLGVSRFVEVGPDGVLSAMARAGVSAPLAERALFVPAMRSGHDEQTVLAGCVGAVHASGGEVDWPAYFAQTGARRVTLPTYAFQRERFWLESDGGPGDLAAVGLGTVDHPMVGAAVPVAGTDEWLFTDSWSLATHGWMADHAVFGTVIAPGTALVELALRAGREVGCATLAELTVEAPLLLPAHGAVQLQIAVRAADDASHRAIEIHSRAAPHTDDDAPPEWVRHASGVLAAGVPDGDAVADRLGGQAWPPGDAERIDVDALYDRLADHGYDYGPAFQGLTAAWRRDDVVFAEVTLDREAAETAPRFGVHPALFDAAFHAALGELREELEPGLVPLPFAWSGVRVPHGGARSLRVMLERSGPSSLRLAALDDNGVPALEVGELRTRPIEAAALRATGAGAGADSLFAIDWVQTPLVSPGDGSASFAVVGRPVPEAADAHPDIGALVRALDADEGPVPSGVLAFASARDGDPAAAARALAAETLALLQAWLADERFADSRLVIVTRGAVAVDGERPDVAHASVWGLVRSAQSEHPGRFQLVDLDGAEPPWTALLATGEPQLAIRDGRAFAPRLARPRGMVAPPGAGDGWRLGIERKGTIEGLSLVASDGGQRPLRDGEVRVGVRAAGLNFRDVLIALGIYPGAAPLGSEAAGVVIETGPGVSGLAPGDRVMGLLTDSFGPLAVTDQRMIVRMPPHWSFVDAASVPAVFLTAYYALVDLAGLQAGERLLVHAAAGGVGTAAVQIAHHLGAEVYATASPAKWDAVRALGVCDEHIASSRDLDFRERLLEASGGDGVDVVLDALAREFVDASLELLPRGGRFVEMGKADVRDPGEVAAAHPGVRYQAFDLGEAGPERIQQMLAEIVELFARGVLRHPPIRTWDVRRSADAFRFLREARHIGKIVLTIPRSFGPEATVLVTGGTAGLGAVVARHLAERHGVRRLLLVSRRGRDAAGVDELVDELARSGCEATVAACDVGDRGALAALLDALEHPLTAVVHAAGVLDDGVVTDLDPERLERVMRPKVDAALNLHELTEHLDLSDFVLFSSAAAVLGSPGQGNYGAANAGLDALAQQRRVRGLPASSLAWGLWAGTGGMSSGLGEQDLARLARMGIRPLSEDHGRELFDAARRLGEPLLLPVSLDRAMLRSAAGSGMLPPLLQGLARAAARRQPDAGGTLAHRLANVDPAAWDEVVLDVVRSHVATVLGLSSAESVDPDRSFKELGVDSLAAVELRNRLVQTTEVELTATLVFDHPTAAAIAAYVRRQLDKRSSTPAVDRPAASGTLGALLRHAHGRGAITETLPLLTEASRFLPDFRSGDELDDDRGYVVRLTSGEGRPALVCVPSFVVGSGPHQFARFANRFDGERDVYACSLPGFRGSEPVPGSWDAAIDVLAGSVRAAVGDDPFVLVGYSIGGVVAHSLAGRLGRDGTVPEGLVLIDTPTPVPAADHGQHVFSSVMTVILGRDGLAVDDRSWLAMGTYLRLVQEWQPGHAGTPSLLIRAGEPLGGAGEHRWPAWDVADDVRVLAADHFELIERYAEATADATDDWLRARAHHGATTG